MKVEIRHSDKASPVHESTDIIGGVIADDSAGAPVIIAFPDKLSVSFHGAGGLYVYRDRAGFLWAYNYRLTNPRDVLVASWEPEKVPA